MTIPADARAAEEAFEAALAGRPVPDGASGLAAFTDAVRSGATVPGRPTAALAELLATGLLTTHQEPSPRTAGHPARTSRKRPRMLLSTLVAKIVGAGALAKAAAGTGVVVVALAGATTTVVAAQDDTTAVVEAPADQEQEVTREPLDGEPVEGAGDESGTGGEAPDEPATDTPDPAAETPGDTTADTPADTPEDPAVPETPLTPQQVWEKGPVPGQSHGSWVSEGAREGWVDGGTVSGQAHARNDARRTAREAAPAAPVDEPVVQAPTDPAPVVQEPAPAATDTRPGNGHGNGKGNGRK